MTTLELNGTTAKERMAEIVKTLEQGVRDVFESDRYRAYLSCISRFWHYSFRNCLLIQMQKPDATRVASIGTWNRLRRTVNRGEQGIRILAPSPYKHEEWVELTDKDGNPVVNPDTGKVLQIRRVVEMMGFRPVVVFDVSQTSGDPLPELATELTGDVQDYDRMMEAIRAIAECPVSIRPLKGRAKGHYSITNREIVIRAGMSPLQTVKTAVHELAHARLHDPRNQLGANGKEDRRTAEVQAESCAFVILDHFGLDTADYSFGYVANWSSGKELDELHRSLSMIQAESERIIDELEQALRQQAEAAEPLAVVNS